MKTSPLEILKIVILTVLVISSIYLTFLIWSFKPEFKPIETEIHSGFVLDGDHKKPTIRQLTLPYQMIEISPTNSKGTTKKKSLQNTLNTLNQAKEIQHKEFNGNANVALHSLDSNGAVDNYIYDFLGEISIQTFLNAYNIEIEAPVNELFDRLIVNTNANHLYLYFMNQERDYIYMLEIDQSSKTFKNNVSKESLKNYSAIITNEFSINNKTALYAPTEVSTEGRFKYITEVINVNQLNNVVFMGDVGLSKVRDGDVIKYHNAEGIAQSNQDTMYYQYTHFKGEIDESMSPQEAFNRANDYLTSHNGYSQLSRYTGYDEETKEVQFRSFVKDLPIFNTNNISRMDLTFGKDDILSYSRGLITLGATVPTKSDPVDLINLEELRHELAKSKSIDLTKVEKIIIGYNITYNKGVNTVEFEPNWFILYEGEWKQYDAQGGIK